ncbi:MAG TPA: SUMF1/EgtB/PvdO family nonheme iron enzyme, partial [Polyangiales bacterium]|nr:SUMF1/EgtB/PvdO family nonheme iron enzyme [Polyangiales bacterium]
APVMAQACIRCQAELPARARFCPTCAYEQTLGPPELSATMASVAPPMPTATPSSKAPAAPFARSKAPPAPFAIDSPTMLNGSPVSLTHLLWPGTIVSGVYTIERMIGGGGMGTVYRAHDSARSRTVALKVIHPSLASDAEIRRRFSREARLMRSFSHPNVASVFDFIEEDNFLAIVMEHVAGPTLAQEIARWESRMPYPQIRSIMGEMLDAMEEAHNHGVVHRDLKPDNVLLKTDQRRPIPKVVDFGVAKILEGTTFTVTGAMLGTCKYMSPEQVERPALLSYPADIYSLGVTLFEMVTGRCPFVHESHFALMMAHVREQPISPLSLRSDVPPALAQLIMDALQKSPEKRPRSCAEFRARLMDALASFDEQTSEVDELPRSLRDTDGGELLLVPEGFFGMGQERRPVFLDAFYMDRFPVTNRQYASFLAVTGYRSSHPDFLALWRDGRVPNGLEQHPVVHVSWFDAHAYAQWAGKSLPSEAQWEKAARGTDGRKYPWGKVAPDATRANYGRLHRGTVAVGSCPAGASPYGVEDLAGNVWEWCEDVDAQDFYARGPSHNPCNRAIGPRARMVVRGGSFMYDAPSVRTTARTSFEPDAGAQGIGFRCVRHA